MFDGGYDGYLFNIAIGVWDTSSATSFSRMFYSDPASVYPFDQQLCWDVAGATVDDMFGSGGAGSVGCATCIAKDASEWANLGCVVGNPAGPCVGSGCTGAGPQLSLGSITAADSSVHAGCSVTCPTNGGQFEVTIEGTCVSMSSIIDKPTFAKVRILTNYFPDFFPYPQPTSAAASPTPYRVLATRVAQAPARAIRVPRRAMRATRPRPPRRASPSRAASTARSTGPTPPSRARAPLVSSRRYYYGYHCLALVVLLHLSVRTWVNVLPPHGAPT